MMNTYASPHARAELDVQIVVAKARDERRIERHAQATRDVGGELQIGIAAEETNFAGVKCLCSHLLLSHQSTVDGRQ